MMENGFGVLSQKEDTSGRGQTPQKLLRATTKQQHNERWRQNDKRMPNARYRMDEMNEGDNKNEMGVCQKVCYQTRDEVRRTNATE